MITNRIRTTVLAALLCVTSLFCQAQLSLPTTVIAGNTYYYYEVKGKESLSDIARTIGVTTQEILRFNPDAGGKLEKKQLLLLPVSFASSQMSPDNQVRSAFGGSGEVSVSSSEAVRHTIQPGETIYSIAKQYNSTVEGILSNNLSLPPSRYVTGQTVRVVPNSALPFYYERSDVRFFNYKIQDGESLYSIARRNGVSAGDLQAANPDLKKVKKGKVIVVPRSSSERVLGDMRSISLADLESYYAPRIDELHARLLAERRNAEVNVAMLLPFQLHKNPAPRQGYLYTDFYKGFLLALDSAGHQASRRINLRVLDTEHNLNVTDSLLSLAALQDLDLLIAPGEPKQLERMNAFGRANNIDVVNCFSAKNTDYALNANVIEVNTPTPRFTERVLDWFGTQFEGCHVIYLVDASSEGKEIFDDLRSHISLMGMPSSTLTVSGELSFDALSRAMNPGTRYALVPSSSSKELLRKSVKALKRAKQERFDCEFVLVGYPEYVTYLTDFQSDLQDIDTYVFSRFFNSKGARTRSVEAMYKRSFAGDILSSVPNMVLLGFDLGMYVINTLGQGVAIDTDAPLYRGVQTNFKFERTTGQSGLVNRAIDIIHFSTDHKITTLVQQ